MEEKIKMTQILDPIEFQRLFSKLNKDIESVKSDYYGPNNKPSPGDIGAAFEDHTHTPEEIGIASADDMRSGSSSNPVQNKAVYNAGFTPKNGEILNEIAGNNFCNLLDNDLFRHYFSTAGNTSTTNAFHIYILDGNVQKGGCALDIGVVYGINTFTLSESKTYRLKVGINGNRKDDIQLIDIYLVAGTYTITTTMLYNNLNNAAIDNIMLNAGDGVKSYRPQDAVCLSTPRQAATLDMIEKRSANLFDPKWLRIGDYNNTTDNTRLSIYHVNRIPVNIGETYSVSVSSGYYVSIGIADSNSALDSSVLQLSDVSDSLTVTANYSGYLFLVFRKGRDGQEIFNSDDYSRIHCMLTKGEKNVPYHPYSGGLSYKKDISSIQVFESNFDPVAEIGGVWQNLGSQTVGSQTINYWKRVA